jgi:hypothetical protein
MCVDVSGWDVDPCYAVIHTHIKTLETATPCMNDRHELKSKY